ncbi:MAG: SDR family oxidoreductase [Actinobacteria bacterium]|nr:SDR family oxidoreductase [Actinomycetota bacterium]
MGTAIRARLQARGDTVVSADLHDADVIADVTVVAECERMVAETLALHGNLDILVCAAGVWVEGPTWQTTEDEWDRTIDVNLKGAFFSCRYAIPHLMATEGCAVLISSDYGLVGGPGAAVYNASKFGVNGITRSLALELAPHGVRVNSVCPADVDTPMLAGQARDYGNGDPQGYLAKLRATLPQAERSRFIRPDEIAALVAFLTSDEATPITGACIPIEWGVTAGY